MKNRLILATMTLSLAMCGTTAYAGAGFSHPATSVTLPMPIVSEIESIRQEFFKVLSHGNPACDDNKRLTIMIVPFSPESSSDRRAITRNRSTTQFSEESSAPLSASDIPSPKREKGTLTKHKSESHLGMGQFSKSEELTGCHTYANRIPVTCGLPKSRVLRLINRPDLNNPQKLLVLQKLCAPCTTDESFIYGNISEIISLKPEQIVSIEASLLESSSGSLNISCKLTNGTELICFI